MLRLLSLCFVSLFLVGCNTHDEQYYRLHPKALQQTLSDCQKVPAANCQKLAVIAKEMNQLAYSLQANPQEFGQKIIGLQGELAELHADD